MPERNEEPGFYQRDKAIAKGIIFGGLPGVICYIVVAILWGQIALGGIVGCFVAGSVIGSIINVRKLRSR